MKFSHIVVRYERSEIFAGSRSATLALTEAIKSLSNVLGREADIGLHVKMSLSNITSPLCHVQKSKKKNSAGGKSYSGKPATAGVLPNGAAGQPARPAPALTARPLYLVWSPAEKGTIYSDERRSGTIR
ncbi:MULTISPECIES: hypothetical protein [Pantoea]|uniref:Uncharacterized protein n=2 Tax=Erwiniaceae TaxID=1903409 RepID=A0ABS6VK03_9GAMM|nr:MULTISPECIES: hypothetical protein [Pantoea]MBW1215870.1 hypothetical protein [Pantoea allii]MBW1259386.1 hypothetical protein [Pantoea allii]MBW1268568.1 hypothetical protein [Pantoea allii]MBW1290576.1 hypothetical protein [Pantoea allii]